MKKLLTIFFLAFPLFSKTEAPSARTDKVHIIDKNTIIELTDDIIIGTNKTPFIASKSFGSTKPEKLIFTSKAKKSVIIAKKSIWDLSSFDSKNKIIEFRGNAQLICEPGSKIVFNNGLLRFAESSRWLIT